MAYVSYVLEIAVPAVASEIGTMAADTTCNIYIVNRGTVSGNVSLYIGAAAGAADCVLFTFPIKPSATFILTDVYIKSGDKVFIDSPADFTVRVEGKEEATV